jgi:hypothetical protein
MPSPKLVTNILQGHGIRRLHAVSKRGVLPAANLLVAVGRAVAGRVIVPWDAWVYTLRPMAGGAVLVGILLLVVILRGPPGKPLFSTTIKVIVFLVLILFAAYLLFVGMYAPMAVPYLLEQALGCVIIIGIFVAIGTAVRKRRDKREAKKLA